MNEAPLTPKENGSFFSLLFTRPSPLPPSGVELGVLEVAHIRCPQGTLFPKAENYFCSLVWCTEGQFTIHVNNMTYPVRSGQFLLLEPGGTIDVQADEAANETYYLLFDGTQASTIISESGFWNGVFPYIRPPDTWLERIAQEMDNLKKQKNMASIGHALLMSAFQDATNEAPDKMVWDARCFLQKNWNRKGMNVETVLNHLNVSRSTLSPRFRKTTGKTLLEYLMEIRYRNATKMLLNDYASVSTIAHRCGFPDADYFSVWFRKRHGQSPSTIKRKVAS